MSKLSYLGKWSEPRENARARVPRGFAARSHVFARLASLAQIGELARRLKLNLTCNIYILFMATSVPNKDSRVCSHYSSAMFSGFQKCLHLSSFYPQTKWRLSFKELTSHCILTSPNEKSLGGSSWRNSFPSYFALIHFSFSSLKNKEFTWNQQTKKVPSLKTDIIKGYGPGILTATINEDPATFIAIKTKNRDKKFLVAWFPADSLYLLGNLKALSSSSSLSSPSYQLTDRFRLCIISLTVRKSEVHISTIPSKRSAFFFFLVAITRTSSLAYTSTAVIFNLPWRRRCWFCFVLYPSFPYTVSKSVTNGADYSS